MRNVILIGNWKATPETLKEATSYASFLSRKKYAKTKELWLAVPFPFIFPFDKNSPSFVKVGSQNITALEGGPHTGGVTASMILSMGCSFTLIGHSEVRKSGETDHDVAEKTAAAAASGLTAVVCIGEESRDDRDYLAAIESQLKKAVSLLKREHYGKLILAYEPLWAIGGNVSATESQVFEVIIMLRRALVTLVGLDIAKKVRLLYGGTVTEENASRFIEDGGVDGLLVGRASWKPENFIRLHDSIYDISR